MTTRAQKEKNHIAEMVTEIARILENNNVTISEKTILSLATNHTKKNGIKETPYMAAFDVVTSLIVSQEVHGSSLDWLDASKVSSLEVPTMAVAELLYTLAICSQISVIHQNLELTLSLSNALLGLTEVNLAEREDIKVVTCPVAGLRYVVQVLENVAEEIYSSKWDDAFQNDTELSGGFLSRIVVLKNNIILVLPDEFRDL